EGGVGQLSEAYRARTQAARSARGSGFGGRLADWGTVAAWAGGIATSLGLGWRCWWPRRCSTRSVGPVADHLRARQTEVPHRGTRRAARAGRGGEHRPRPCAWLHGADHWPGPLTGEIITLRTRPVVDGRGRPARAR